MQEIETPLIHQSGELAPVRERQVTPEIARQIDSFFSPLIIANEQRFSADIRRPEEYESLQAYYSEYTIDHNLRAEEIRSPEYQEVIQLAISQFKNPVFGVDCMDGRNEPAIQHGFSAGIFGRFRNAGGILGEVVPSAADQRMKLIKGKFTDALDAALEKYDVITQRFDSHVACAAREAIEVARKGGTPPVDHGLYRDVVAKRKAASAVERYVHENFPDRRVNTMLESFDPHTGYLYSGLNTKSAFMEAERIAKENAIALGKDPEKAEPEFTEEVLKHLAETGKILSTSHMAQNPDIRRVLNQYYFEIDWQNNYVGSAKLFWENIALPQRARSGEEIPALKDVLLPAIKDKLQSIYPHLHPNSEEFDPDALHDRAMLVLTNLYSGFLHNPNIRREESPGHSEEDHHRAYKGYPYPEHEESGIDITEGDYGPYPTLSVLTVSPYEQNPGNQLMLSNNLIRGNRLNGRVKDFSGKITDPEEFAAAPVPITVTEIIRNADASLYDDILAKVDWSDMPQNWDVMTHEVFDKYLDKKSQSIPGGIPHSLARSVKILRERTAGLYKTMGTTLINHDMVAMPIIEGPNRKVLGIVPFVKVGY